MNSPPNPLPQPDPVPQPQDTPYCGPIRLKVDATDVRRRIFRCHARIPIARPGLLTLLFPKWLPGFHAPQAPIELLAGLSFRAEGTTLHWERHPVTVNAFTVTVPDGAAEIEAEFQFLSPTEPAQGRVIASTDMLMLPWSSVVLYPAGHFARQIEVDASITLPEDWQFACALEQQSRDGATVHFERAQLDILVDSPIMAGRHFRAIDLDDHGEVRLNIAADRPDLIDVKEEQIAAHRAVVAECDRLFGIRHFPHYDVLLALSDELTSAGIEHHSSCEAVSITDYFTGWDKTFARRDTFPHEYVHSWNGKHRRGADSWAPCFETPIRNSLMWVYEGQTQYWSRVLCARSGLWSLDQALGALAQTAATYDTRPGSRWRPIIDTTRDPIIAARAPLPWASWQRSEDYYSEGALMWLGIDTRIRELTDDARSLDDFARAFFGRAFEAPVTQTYKFRDVVSTLEALAPFDWQGLLEDVLTETHGRAPLDGIERGGYRLVYRTTPSAFATSATGVSGVSDLSFSIGLMVNGEGKISDVLWEGPAFAQGIIAGATLLGVNERSFSIATLEEALAATARGTPLALTVRSGQEVRRVMLDYDGGGRYPHLEPIADGPRRLEAIFAPRRGSA